MRGMAYPCFVGISGWVKGKTYETELRLGPDPGCVLVFPQDSAVSAQHAGTYERSVKRVGNELNSTSGAYLNGARLPSIQDHVFHHGDILKIDDCRFVHLKHAEAGQAGLRADEAERIRRASTIGKAPIEEVVAEAGR